MIFNKFGLAHNKLGRCRNKSALNLQFILLVNLM